VNAPTPAEIDAAILAYDDAPVEELAAFTDATGSSKGFPAHVMSSIRLILEGNCPTEITWASMVVMLWVGMAIERRRREVATLNRMYAQEGV